MDDCKNHPSIWRVKYVTITPKNIISSIFFDLNFGSIDNYVCLDFHNNKTLFKFIKKEIIKIDHIMDITPDNVLEKINLYSTFQ